MTRSPKHLAFIRELRCVSCHKWPPSEPAHVRIMGDGGMGRKPSDSFVVPLCASVLGREGCHAKQHRVGERTFWANSRIDPHKLAEALWNVSGDIEAGNRIVFRARMGSG